MVFDSAETMFAGREGRSGNRSLFRLSRSSCSPHELLLLFAKHRVRISLAISIGIFDTGMEAINGSCGDG